MTGLDASTIVLLTGEGTSVVARVVLDLGARARWATQLDAALRNAPAETIAVAEGLAAVALAYWIQLSPRSYLAPLRGVVLHAPASTLACAGVGLDNLPATHLPLPAIVVGRTGEDAARHLALADRWGARYVPEHQRVSVSATEAVEARLLAVARADLGAIPLAAPLPGEVVAIRAAV